ncbi:MAG: amino acid adenylation domain-containing protein [Flavobacteriales bacterium]|nr:amino acid adenylation domain-containing protein [Flavobacteriales bacterium]
MEQFIKENRYIPVDYDPFTGNPVELTAPTTEPQREVWAASQVSEEASCSYNESVSLDFDGALDEPVLRASITALVQRHESLRAVFDSTGTRMVVQQSMPIELEIHDLAGIAKEAQEERMENTGHELMSTSFDLSRGPLMRFILFRLGDAKHVLRIVAHHIVCDGWSMSILIGDLSKIYAAGGSAEAANLPAPVAASRYAQEMNAFYASDANKEVKAYWKQLFAPPLPQLDLPTDHPRPWEKTWNARRIDIPMEQELVDGLKKLGTRFGSSFVTTLLSVYEVLLARITGQRDIVVGMPAAGQSDMGMEELVGHCVALLPLRSTIDDALPFSTYLQQRRTALLDAFDHQRFTFSTLLHELNIPRDPGRVPLVPVIFNLDMEMDDRVSFPGISHSLRSEPRSYEQFELAMNASSSGGAVVMEWSFNTDLFDESTVRGWMQELGQLVRQVVAEPATPLVALLEEGKQLAEFPRKEWVGEASATPADMTIAAAFDRVAKQRPDHKALVQGDASLTYGELRDRVDALAVELLEAGVRKGMPVAICAEPGFDLITGLLAVVRVGGAFLPIDHNYPQARLDYLLSDSKAPVLLTRTPWLPLFKDYKGTIKPLDGSPGRSIVKRPELSGTTDDAAYIIYTSGSTGEPKGTVVPHRGIMRIVHGKTFVPFGPELTTLMHLSISFDACQLTIMGTLLTGGTMVIPASEKPVLSDFVGAIRNQGVNCLFSASGYFKLLVDEHLEDLKRLRYFITGGDAISVPHVRKALRTLGPGVVINVYGPTEATILATAYPVVDESWAGGSIPIGKPIGNTLLHVLDPNGRPVRTGQTGELHIGGSGVALGYLNRPEQTAAHFLPDPFSTVPGAMMYRTGDMVLWNDEGELEFTGRVDDQVKVRGFRVELGEVEAALNDLAIVKDKVVVALPASNGEKQLVLYVVPADPSWMVATGPGSAHEQEFLSDVREHLERVLPTHMVPPVVQVLPAMPLNSSGKPDKGRLPRPTRTAHLRMEHVAPRNELEGVLASIWGRLLDLEQVSIHDNFFEIGGHSLLGIQMFAQVERQLGRRLPIKTLFQAPTIAKLAETINQAEQPVVAWTNLSAIQPHGDRPPFFCIHGDEANVFIPRHIGKDQPFYGFFHQGEDGHPVTFRTVRAIASHFIKEMRQVRPHGPYFLGGYSFGGIVAFEMACQLTSEGEEVPLLALFDSYAPAESVSLIKKEEKLHEPLKRLVMRRLIRHYFDKGRVLPPKLRHFHIIDTYGEASKQYAPPVFPGKVTLIRTTVSPGTPDMGWAELARDGVDIRHTPGDHYSLIKEPHVRALAQELRASMDQVLLAQAVTQG